MAAARKKKVDSEAAFLDAIRASPDDDAPRLVYADHLLESGDEKKRAYGEFIIAQCELASGSKRTPEWRRAWSREADLEPIVTRGFNRDGAEEWQRGFPLVICRRPEQLTRVWKRLAPPADSGRNPRPMAHGPLHPGMSFLDAIRAAPDDDAPRLGAGQLSPSDGELDIRDIKLRGPRADG